METRLSPSLRKVSPKVVWRPEQRPPDKDLQNQALQDQDNQIRTMLALQCYSVDQFSRGRFWGLLLHPTYPQAGL